MANVVQYGSDLMLGVGNTCSNYIIESFDFGDCDLTTEDIRDEDNQLVTRVIYQKMDKLSASLIPLEGANVATDFVVSEIGTVPPFDNYYIDSAKLTRTGGVAKLQVSGTKIGIS